MEREEIIDESWPKFSLFSILFFSAINVFLFLCCFLSHHNLLYDVTDNDLITLQTHFSLAIEIATASFSFSVASFFFFLHHNSGCFSPTPPWATNASTLVRLVTTVASPPHQVAFLFLPSIPPYDMQYL